MKKILLVVNKLLFIVVFYALISNASMVSASWTSGGPHGGYITRLAMSDSNPDIIYAGTYFGGIYKSNDGGNTWSKTGFYDYHTLTVTVAPDDPDIVYAGTLGGIYKSEDGGDSWPLRRLDGYSVNSIAIDPHNSQILFIGTSKPGESNAFGAIYKSTDGGETGEAIFEAAENEGVHSILIDEDNSSHIYVGLQTTTGSGINFSKSTDGGETWQYDIIIGPSYMNDVVELAMSPAGSDPGVIYAIVNSVDVFKSFDRGTSWTATSVPSISGGCDLVVDPNEPDIVYVGESSSSGNIYKTIDAGNNWLVKENGIPGGDPVSFAVDPSNSDLYIGLYGGGIYKSTNGAESWFYSSHGLNATHITDITVDLNSPNTIYSTVAGEGQYLAKSNNGGISWNYLLNSPTNLTAVKVQPDNSSNVLVGGNHPIGMYRSWDGGETWTNQKLFIGVGDIWINPVDPSMSVVAASSGFESSCDPDGWCTGPTYGLYWTTFYGSLWDQRLDQKSTTLAQDPNNITTIYVGTKQNGYVLKSTGGGFSWSFFSPDGIWVNEVIDIEVDLNSHVYAATDQGLMKLEGYGISRKLEGLPTDNINAIAIDLSTSPGIVYVGTWGYGVYVSEDGGSNWTSFNKDLGNLYITKLAISTSSPQKLYAGTSFGGVWSREIEIDSDSDGLPDDLENANCTHVDNQDTDNDGIMDGFEDVNRNGIVDLDETDPCDIDTDNDGVQDGTELGYALDEIGPDTNTVIFQPDLDPATITDPLLADTDGDSILDGIEDVNHNGIVDTEETDPNKPDTDDDGLDDGIEVAYWGESWNTDLDDDLLINLLDPDSDNDGLNDGVEVNILGTNPALTDTDGNGIPDGDEDSDNDGVTNVEEATCGSDPADSSSRCNRGLPWLMLLLD